MIRARGERRWYLVYQAEKEQFSMSWPVTGGNSMFVIVWKGFFLNKGGIFAGTKVGGDHSPGDRRGDRTPDADHGSSKCRSQSEI
jgi:hypothetical protein